MRSRVVVLVSSLFLAAVIGQAAVPTTERDALIALYNATGGASWTNRTNWNGAPGTECTWHGITCNAGGTNVTEIDLFFNNLTGALPNEIGNFSQLTYLDLSSNKLTGAIPPALGQLSMLQALYISFNGFTAGPFPPSIFSLTNLVVLDLSATNRTGPFPTGFAALTRLRFLYLGDNNFDPGPFPSELLSMSALQGIHLFFTNRTGTIPPAIGNLSSLNSLILFGNQLTGTIPSSLGNLPLTALDVGINDLSSPIPPGLANLVNLTTLGIDNNRFNEPFPSWVTNLTKLRFAYLGTNEFTGSFPSALTNLVDLEVLEFGHTRITGSIPPAIGNLKKLRSLQLDQNDLSGTIPPEIGQLTSLTLLHLGGNRFTGTIPPQIGLLTGLRFLEIDASALRSPVPREILNLTNLINGRSAFDRQQFDVSDADIRNFLALKQDPTHGDWEQTQTVTPRNVTVSAVSSSAIRVSWQSPEGGRLPGGFEVLTASSSSGPFTSAAVTTSKGTREVTLENLQPSTTYFVVVRSFTQSHVVGEFLNAYGRLVTDVQKNQLVSDNSPPVSATTNPRLPTPAQVVVTALPVPMTQIANVAGGLTSYVLRNVGETATTITLSQNGDFFRCLGPASLPLAAGATQTISIEGLAQPAGLFNGESIVSGTGVPPGLRIAISLLSAAPPTGSVNAVPQENRVDVSAPAGESPTGKATFKNTSNNTLTGFLSSDAPWIIPQPGLITIAPQQSREVSFTIDRSRRPDAGDIGSVVGTLKLIFLSGPASKQALSNHIPTGSSQVSITDSVNIPVTQVTVPPLAPGEVALVVPGVGHVVGSVGLFVSDLSIVNAGGSSPIDNLAMYYSSLNTGITPVRSIVPRVSANQPIAMADIVKTIFRADQQVGSLQIRTSQIASLGVAASIFNSSNSVGTYGTVIPVFRSDRVAARNVQLYLTGLRADATSHTNVFVQELGGSDASVLLDFYDANGNRIGSPRTENVGAFRLIQLQRAVPDGAVSAILTNLSGSAATLQAYATPVDRASGDTWAVADWPKVLGYSGTEPVVIPIAGAVAGALNTYFRTDIAIMNNGGIESSGTMRYYARGGGVTEKSIRLGANQTLVVNDVVTNFFAVAPGTIGHIVVIPTAGSSFAVTSRTYTTVVGQSATFGTGVPTVAIASTLKNGQTRRFGGIDDAATSTIAGAKPATYRTNIGMVETSGQSAKVRVTIHYTFVAGPVGSRGSGSKDYDLAPNQLLLVNNVAKDVLGAFRDSLGDLRNLQLDVRVVDGNGSVAVFTSTLDNGTSDSLLRIE